MPIKWQLGKDTGIYRQDWWRATDPKSQIKRARIITRAYDIEWQLRGLERKARAILRKQNIPLRGTSKLPVNVSRSADGMTRDAAHVLWQAFIVRDWLAEGNARCAALHALMLGAAAERMAVRPFEPYAKTGRKIKESARRGGLMRKPPTGTWATWQTEVNDLHDRHPDLSFRAIAKIVGKNFNRDERTIRRRTKNPH